MTSNLNEAGNRRLEWLARHWYTAFLLLIGLLVVGTSVRYSVKAMTPSREGTLTRTAFLRWRGQIHELMAGDNVYQKYNYPNPPVMALILAPLTKLPLLPGALAWFYLKVLMALGVIVWSVRLASEVGQSLPIWVGPMVLLLSLHPILGDLTHGNVNIFIAFLVLAGIELFRRGFDLGSGLVFALATACKVTPALFLPYLLWKRAWRAAAAMTVGLGLWWFVAPAAYFGWQENLTLLESWYDGMVKPFVVEGKITSERANQSIPGVATRLLTRQPSEWTYDPEDFRPIPAEYHNLTDIGPEGAKWVVRGFQSLFLVAGLLLFWTPIHRPDQPRQGLRFAAEIGLILLGMLLFSERTWKHHSVTLSVPFAVLTAALVAYSPGLLRSCLQLLLGIAVGFAVVPSLLPEGPRDVALIYGSHTVAFLSLSTAMVLILAERAVSVPRRPAADRS